MSDSTVPIRNKSELGELIIFSSTSNNVVIMLLPPDVLDIPQLKHTVEKYQNSH